MTTTADKIKVMQAFDEWKKNGFDQPAVIEKAHRDNEQWEDVGYEPLWNWEQFEYRIKPPEPEPLECWVNVWPHQAEDEVFRDKESAHIADLDGNCDRLAVHMREVTPQDELDRQDARRYRQAKEEARKGTTMWFWNRADPEDWDGLLDARIDD